MNINFKFIVNLLTVSLAAINLVLISNYIIYPIIDVDSGYYLAMAREIYAGKVYFHEIGIPYNPLSIVTMGIPYLFSSDPDYFWHLLVNMIVFLCSTKLIYNILSFISKDKYLNRFYALFFLLLCLVLHGKHALLEPLSVCFQLIALWLFLKTKKDSKTLQILLVGLFIALAFLSKQYGLFIAVPIGIQIFIDKKNIIKKILLLGMGFLLPLVVFYTYLSRYNVSLPLFLKYILGQGLEMDQGNGTSLETTFFTYPMDSLYILLFNLYILLVPYLILKYFKKLNNNKYLFIITCLISFMVLYFANYWHYYQYIIPYTIILYVFLSQNGEIKKKSIILPLVSICFLSFYALNSLNKKENVEKYRKETELFLNKIPERSEVFLSGPSQLFYYTCKFKSINLKNIGYTFPNYLFPKTIVNNLKTGSYIVVSEKQFNIYKELIEKYSINEILLNDKKYIVIKKE